MKRVLGGVLSMLGALLTAPALAVANGDTAHAWITERAIEHLPSGQLERLLSRPDVRDILINGSVFPDGGYVVGDDYGEIAHWEPFLTAYIDWIRTTYDTPLTDGDAATHAVFLLGIASHGLADQTFDSAFGPAARIHDAAGWSDDLLQDHDSMTDLILVGQTGRRFDGLPAWVPADDLSAIYRDRMGYQVDPDVLLESQDLLHRLTLGYAAIADEAAVMRAAARYPWSAENLLDVTEPGAPPDQAEIVADYWLAIWDRLHGVSDPQNVVIATSPRTGAAGVPIDRDLIESQLTIVFGHGFETRQLAVEVVDDTGKVYELELASPWNVEVTNLLRIRPLEDWADQRDFTVTLAAPVTSIDGLVMTEPFRFTFSTRSAPASEPSSDPTPHHGEPDVGSPPAMPPPITDRPEHGGCAAGAGAGPLAAIAGVLMARRRRRGPH